MKNIKNNSNKQSESIKVNKMLYMPKIKSKLMKKMLNYRNSDKKWTI